MGQKAARSTSYSGWNGRVSACRRLLDDPIGALCSVNRFTARAAILPQLAGAHWTLVAVTQPPLEKIMTQSTEKGGSAGFSR